MSPGIGKGAMTLQVVPVQGFATWWTWTIRDAAHALIEQSTVQFRSAAIAEARGRARLVVLETSQLSDPWPRARSR
jgi:hypothetical protein